MTPLPMHLVFCYLAVCTVTEGRIVRGIIGRSVSFSMTFDNGDLIHIKHNSSTFVTVWPDNNNRIKIQQPDRVRVVIGNKTMSNTVTVIINILNLTRNDIGMYRAIRPLTATEIKDSILLETIDKTLIPNIETVPNYGLDPTLVLKCKVSYTSAGKFLWSLNGSLIENNNIYFQNDTFLYIRNVTAENKYNLYTCKESGGELESDPYSIQIWINLYTTKAITLIEDTTETNQYTTQTLRTKEDTEGIYITTATASIVNAEDPPLERRLLYIIFGMGALLAAAFLACLLHKIRICLSVVRGSNINTVSNNDDRNENVQEVNQAEHYWTIVSNAKGEMSTAIEADSELSRESLLVGPIIVPMNNESDESMRSDDIYVSQEIDGYFNPINSRTIDFNDYIHPIHSNPLNTYLPSEVSVCNMNMSTRRDVKSISI